MAKAKIVGTGLYAPGEPIDNEELMRLAGVEFDAAKLEEKIGIRTRHIARLRGIDETTADFAEKAARAALADAGVDADDVGLFIVATDTPEYVSPATAILLQGRLQGGEREAGAFDVGASCASFVTALDAAARMIVDRPGPPLRPRRRRLQHARRTCGPATRSAGRSSPTARARSSSPGPTDDDRVGLRRRRAPRRRHAVELRRRLRGRHAQAGDEGAARCGNLGPGAAAEAPRRPQREAVAAARAPAAREGGPDPRRRGPPDLHADQPVGHRDRHGRARPAHGADDLRHGPLRLHGLRLRADGPRTRRSASDGSRRATPLVLVASGAGLAVGANLVVL